MALINKKQLKKNKKAEQLTEQEFLEKADDYKADFNPDLTRLSLEDLASQFIEIDRQSHLLKGKILLEARNRFSSDKEFGQWVSTHSLCVGSQQSRNRLMHLADFFGDDRDMLGITITSAYEISAPINQNTALQVYKKIRGKNLPVKEVKALFLDKNNAENKKDKEIPLPKKPTEEHEDIQYLVVEIVDKIMRDRCDDLKLAVLKEAISYIKKRTS